MIKENKNKIVMFKRDDMQTVHCCVNIIVTEYIYQ